MRRVMGSRKVVVLETDNKVTMDPGDVAREVKAHCQRVVHGGLRDWMTANEYYLVAPKPRNSMRLPRLLRSMITKVMQEAVQRSTMRHCSRGFNRIDKPLSHVLAGFLLGPMTKSIKWQLATRYIPREPDHGTPTSQRKRGPRWS